MDRKWTNTPRCVYFCNVTHSCGKYRLQHSFVYWMSRCSLLHGPHLRPYFWEVIKYFLPKQQPKFNYVVTLPEFFPANQRSLVSHQSAGWWAGQLRLLLGYAFCRQANQFTPHRVFSPPIGWDILGEPAYRRFPLGRRAITHSPEF